MALLWEHHQAGTHYQVTQAGNSIRLYSNRVFHSQWNASMPVCGQLWESLLLPAFFLEVDKPLRVLLLGVGGGAVVNLLNHFLTIEHLDGVELDPVHLKIARRWFKSKKTNVNYHCAEAVSWVRSYRGPRFDLIIEDLFGSDVNGEVLRAVPAHEKWLRLLGRNLKRDGVLCMNFESIRQAKKAWQTARVATDLTCAGLLTSKRNENVIALLRRTELNVKHFKQNLYRWPELDIRKTACKLDFAYRKLRT